MLGRARGRVRAAFFRVRHPAVAFGHRFAYRGGLVIRGPGTVRIGDHVTFDDATGRPNRLLTFDPDASISIGNNCYINGLEVACKQRVVIEDRCIIAECLIMDTDFHSIAPERFGPGVDVKTAAVHIGRNAWLANKTIILRGVSIGENSVIGAGSVVTRDVPPNSVAAGNPARVIRPIMENR